MAHLIDTSKGYAAAVFFAAPAWHGLGKVLHNPISALDALQQAGLDYTVIKLPNQHNVPISDTEFEEVISEDSFFTYRTDVRKILGTKLGKDYQVLQNIEALNVVDEILQTGSASIETAGAIDEGRKVFICLKVNKEIVIGSDDVVKQYVLIATSHDGSLSITAMPTNIRVVCHNTLSAALRNSKDKIKIRHTANAQMRLQEAAKVLRLIEDNTGLNEDAYNQMKGIVISKQEMWNYFGNIFLTPKEIAGLQKGERDAVKTKKQNILDSVMDFSMKGQGQAMAMHGSDFTMWSAYNAVTGYLTRKKHNSVNDRANSMLFGSVGETIETAGVLALNKAKIQPLHKSNLLSGYNFN